ncbi:DHHW family protein [Bacillus sp. 1P06AnD]|uniref:DHHW family protein n=1 Tax=Bacillus sp. 1P06AnD TaxID=3132208 RepID=UPI0039A1226D
MYRHKSIGLLFAAMISALFLFNLIHADQPFSDRENRPLAKMPDLTLQQMINGRFSDDFETYTTDQFAGKKAWVAIKALNEQLLLKKENNSIYKGKKGYLLEKYNQPGKQLMDNVGSLHAFAERYPIKSTLLLVPTAAETLKELLPFMAPSSSQMETIQKVERAVENVDIKVIHPLAVLEKGDMENYYFKTDHHWTMHAAYKAYAQLGKRMGYKPLPKEAFSVRTVTTDFSGTLESKSNFLGIDKDRIDVYFPLFSMKYSMILNNEMFDSIYDESYLKGKDQYAYFLKGNHPFVKLTSEAKTGKKLLVIKDSYAHVLVPFLMNHFSEIDMVDLRYNHSNIGSLLIKENYDQLLYVYNVATFSTDRDFIWLRQ